MTIATTEDMFLDLGQMEAFDSKHRRFTKKGSESGPVFNGLIESTPYLKAIFEEFDAIPTAQMVEPKVDKVVE